jgi:hypothetical protein
MVKCEYIIRLRAQLNIPTKDQIRNLRAILKRLGRTHGFHCVSCEPATKPEEEN